MESINEVEIQNVSKQFGSVTALDSVSLSVLRGEFLTLLGPSGCGKTTLLRMIAGFESPDSGNVLLGGNAVTDLPPHQRQVTTVFQHYALFPHMNVQQNVAFGLERRRLQGDEIRRRVAAALDLVRLVGLEQRRPDELSGGQQQRVALARSLVVEPRVLLLDEPLAALDLKLRKQMQIELKGLQRRLGISFIYVTHDQEEALTMSDRIVVMNSGRIEQIGIAKEIYEHPRTEFVAGFIGVSNILEALNESNGAENVIRVGKTIVNVSNNFDSRSDRRIRVFIRPEKINITSTEVLFSLRGRIESGLYLGESTQWTVKVEDGQSLIVVEQNRESSTAVDSRIGETVFLSWQPESATILEN